MMTNIFLFNANDNSKRVIKGRRVDNSYPVHTTSSEKCYFSKKMFILNRNFLKSRNYYFFTTLFPLLFEKRPSKKINLFELIVEIFRIY